MTGTCSLGHEEIRFEGLKCPKCKPQERKDKVDKYVQDGKYFRKVKE